MTLEFSGDKTYPDCTLCDSEYYLCSDEGKDYLHHSCLLNVPKGSVWEEKKAVKLNVDIPDGRIVSRVQVELTTVKLCISESESPTVDFSFADPSGNDPHPLVSTVFLSDNCGCDICPASEDGLDWSDAIEKKWRGSKDFVLDVNFEGINSTLCIKTLTIKIHFTSELSFLYANLQLEQSQKLRIPLKNRQMITAETL